MVFYIQCAVIAAILMGSVWFYKMLMNPALRYHTFLYKAKASILFFLGDIRWPRHGHWMSARDIREACEASQPGDIGLHRDALVLSNWGIPGCFKHAWFVSSNDDCVEAQSEGVLKWDKMEPLLTDYAVILRPRGVTPEDIETAIKRADSIVGCEYDANFRFDFAKDDAALQQAWAKNISSGAFHGAFSCTETAGFSWYHKRDLLEIFRTMHAGREAIVADDFLRMNFDIVYASPNVTVEWAEKMGLHEEGRVKIAQYWADKGK